MASLIPIKLNQQVGSSVGYDKLPTEIRLGIYHDKQLYHLFHFVQIAKGTLYRDQTIDHGRLGRFIALLFGNIPTQLAGVEHRTVGQEGDVSATNSRFPLFTVSM